MSSKVRQLINANNKWHVFLTDATDGMHGKRMGNDQQTDLITVSGDQCYLHKYVLSYVE